MLWMEEEVADERALSSEAVLERFLMAQRIASPAALEIVSSFTAGALPPRIAVPLAAALAELVAMFVEHADGIPGVRLYAATSREGADVVLAVALSGVSEALTWGESALRAFRRAERLVRLVGGTVESGVDRGMLVVGAMIDAGPDVARAEGC